MSAPGEQVQGLDSQDLVIKAMNDRKFLYLQIGSSAQHIKSQLLGAFGQDFVIWFDSTRERRKDHGLSIRFSPAAGLAYPKSTDGEPEYLGAAQRKVSILIPGEGGLCPSPLDGGRRPCPWTSKWPRGS